MILPRGILTTGWPSTRATCAKIGITFDPWQDGAGKAILGKNEQRLYTADAVVLAIPRQVGKTYLVGAIIFALCLQTPSTLAVWTAHHAKTSKEAFDDLKAFAESPKCKPFIRRVYDSGGRMEIVFSNRSRIVFGAREHGFGRGFKRVAILVFDEAQILSENAIDNMVPTTNRHPNPLIFYMGTPPKPSDPSTVFMRLRNEAIAGEDDGSTLYIECSADEGADPNDRDQWAKANPSYPFHTTDRAMLRMKKTLSHDSFMREALGIFDTLGNIGVFEAGAWAKAAAKRDEAGELLHPLGEPLALGIACDLDQVWLSVGAVMGSQKPHLGSVHRMRIDEKAKFVAEVKRIHDTYGVPVGIDKKGPASILIPDLEEAGVDLTFLSLDDFVQASADLRQAVNGGEVEHGSYADLDAAVDAATWRKLGERRALARKSGDISAIEAASIALWVSRQPAPVVMEPFVSWG